MNDEEEESPLPTLTVAELIGQLSKFDPNLKVWADGCDCANRVTGVELMDSASVFVNKPRHVRLTIDTQELIYYGIRDELEDG